MNVSGMSSTTFQILTRHAPVAK